MAFCLLPETFSFYFIKALPLIFNCYFCCTVWFLYWGIANTVKIMDALLLPWLSKLVVINTILSALWYLFCSYPLIYFPGVFFRMCFPAPPCYRFFDIECAAVGNWGSVSSQITAELPSHAAARSAADKLLNLHWQNFKEKVSRPGYPPAGLPFKCHFSSVCSSFSLYVSIGSIMAPAKLSGVDPCFQVELSQFSVYHENSFTVVGRKWAL